MSIRNEALRHSTPAPAPGPPAKTRPRGRSDSVRPREQSREGARPTVPERRISNPIVSVGDVPGPLSLGLMEKRGMIVMLDSTAGYLTASAQTVYGRASIARRLVPMGGIAAECIAFWVWFAGPLPREIAVICSSHYRSSVYGRRICVLNRIAVPDEIHHIGSLNVTSPLRTACDIACLSRSDFDRDIGMAAFIAFLQFYEIPARTCMKALGENTRRPGFSNGVRLFDEMLRGSLANLA